MAQTIAIRTGSTSVTWNGTTMTTLFTQSSGTATRVILNSLQMRQSGATGECKCALYHYNSSMGTYNVIGGMQGAPTSSAFAIFPGQNSGPQTAGQTANQSAPQVQTFYSDRGNNLPLSDETNNTYQAFVGNGTGQVFYFPGNFYIGNGDIISVKGYWSNNSGTVYWSFTTVTES